MTEDFIRQANEALAKAANAEVPAELRSLTQEGLNKSREAFEAWSVAARAGAVAMEQLASVTQTAARIIGEKVQRQIADNTESAFAAAETIARAKTLPEIASLQAKYAQNQLTAAGEQGKELLELATKVAQEATAAVTDIANKASQAVKKPG